MRIKLTSVPFRYALLLLVGLIIADGYITEYIIKQGLGREGNPFMLGLLPTGYFMPVKIAGSILVALLLWHIYRKQPGMARVATWLFILVYTGIVYWNVGGAIVCSRF